jgi:hypothetical protein
MRTAQRRAWFVIVPFAVLIALLVCCFAGLMYSIVTWRG